MMYKNRISIREYTDKEVDKYNNRLSSMNYFVIFSI